MATYADNDRQAANTLVGVIGGFCAALGLIVVFGGIAALTAGVIGVEEDMGASGYRTVGWAVIATAAVIVFAGFLLGGYLAGRVERGPAAGNGLLVFGLGFLLAAGAILIVGDLVDINLRSAAVDAGYPTLADPWTNMGIVAAIAIGGAMLLGSVIGGIFGAREERLVVEEDLYLASGERRVVDLRADEDEDATERIRRVERREELDEDGRRVVTHADGTMTNEPEHEHSHR